MKAATGELNLTVITLIAIAAVIGFFWLMWDPIKESISSQWDNVSDKEKAKDSAGVLPGMIVLDDYTVSFNK